MGDEILPAGRSLQAAEGATIETQTRRRMVLGWEYKARKLGVDKGHENVV
jgi:hypothetical protein